MSDHRWLNEVLKHAEEVGAWCLRHDQHPQPFVTMLYGSQNYGLATADSDVDTKTMLFPTWDCLIFAAKPITTEVVMSDGALDNVKDFREMFKNYLKGNINFVETLYTPWYVVHDEKYDKYFAALRGNRDLVSECQPRRLVHMAGGMAEQKYVAFNKQFEGKREVLAKYGYDPKQLHHLFRLKVFIETYMKTEKFDTALHSCDVGRPEHNYVMSLKTDPMPYKEALEWREQWIQEVRLMVDQSNELLPLDDGYMPAKAFLDGVTQDIVMTYLKSVLK